MPTRLFALRVVLFNYMPFKPKLQILARNIFRYRNAKPNKTKSNFMFQITYVTFCVHVVADLCNSQNVFENIRTVILSRNNKVERGAGSNLV